MKSCISRHQNEPSNWLEQELEGSEFRIKQIRSRMLIVMRQLCKELRSSILLACEDWAAIKAAYRLFPNLTVFEHDILKRHFDSTKSRISSIKGPMMLSVKTNVDCSEKVNKKITKMEVCLQNVAKPKL